MLSIHLGSLTINSQNVCAVNAASPQWPHSLYLIVAANTGDGGEEDSAARRVHEDLRGGGPAGDPDHRQVLGRHREGRRGHRPEKRRCCERGSLATGCGPGCPAPSPVTPFHLLV